MKIWGEQKIKTANYRLIRYHLRAECDDGILLYNVVTGELILLNQEEAHALESLDHPSGDVLGPLIKHHFLVPIDFDEKQLVDRLRKILKTIIQVQNITNYTILPTTDCNARCFYCYESNFPHITMAENTAHRLVNYIVRHCGDNKHINIHWFGGEPLVGLKRIDQICEELTANGIQFSSRMTSNAYLFSEDLVSWAKDKWGLKKIQITLDGTESIYNSIKAYNNSDPSPYNRVLNNIGYLIDKNIYVLIRLNLGMHNISDLKTLIDEMAKRYSSKKNIAAYADILFDTDDYKPLHYSDENLTLLETTKIQLNKYIHKKGFHTRILTDLPTLSHSHCMADSGNCLLVSPKGDLSLCEHAIYDEAVGHINSDSLDYKKIAEWATTKDWESCNNCPLYPKCVMLDKCVNLTPCHEVELNYELSQYNKNLIQQYNKATKA